MKPMLDDLELPQVQEISTNDRRMLTEHKPPGLDGSLLQNMGRKPTHLVLWGVVTGPNSLDFVEELDEKFRVGNAVPFIADIVADAEIEEMIIDDLQWQELAGKPERYAYVLTLREFLKPVEPEDTSFIDTDILDEARDLMNELVEGLDLGLSFPTGLEPFVPVLEGFLSKFQQLGQEINRNS
jgi:hypothetical protein